MLMDINFGTLCLSDIATNQVNVNNDLDKDVNLAYRSQTLTSEANRMEFLFGIYEKYTADLFTVEGKKGKKK